MSTRKNKNQRQSKRQKPASPALAIETQEPLIETLDPLMDTRDDAGAGGGVQGDDLLAPAEGDGEGGEASQAEEVAPVPYEGAFTPCPVCGRTRLGDRITQACATIKTMPPAQDARGTYVIRYLACRGCGKGDAEKWETRFSAIEILQAAPVAR